MTFWPVGLILLFRKLTRDSRRRTSRHPYDMRREGAAPGTQGMGRQTPPAGQAYTGRSPRQGKPVNLDRGKGLTIWGIVLAILFVKVLMG